MNRVYKESSPNNTLLKIKKILDNAGIFTYESAISNPHDNIYSTRSQTLDSLGGVGQNGKGLTLEYALASGYGELMERLENDCVGGGNALPFFMLKKLKKEYGFYFFPDEKVLSEGDFKNLPKYLLDDIFADASNEERAKQIHDYFSQLKSKGLEGCIAIPFKDLTRHETIYIPYNIFCTIVGSNGMAAGNTIDEAIYQGTCELFERYAAATIYYNQLTPPTIPNEIIENYASKQYAIIKDLKKFGYNVFVKDFSCNGTLPSIGLLLIKDGKYRLNIGSDTCFEIALSRCLTEVFQGIDNDNIAHNIMRPIPQKEYDYFLDNSEQSIAKRTSEFVDFVKDGTGKFPYSLFKKGSSYSFSMKAFQPASSYKEEVESFVSNAMSQRKNFLVRDTSFLGFPAVRVYIPKISSIGRKNASSDIIVNINLTDNVGNDKLKSLFSSFRELISNPNLMEKVLEYFPPELHTSITIAELMNLSFRDDSLWKIIDISYLLTLFSIKIERYNDAKLYLKTFYDSPLIENKEYYKNIEKYIGFLDEKKSRSYIKKYIPADIIEDMKPDNLFSQLPIPNCPTCAECDLKDSCLTKGRFELQKLMTKCINKNLSERPQFS
jgi:ribosomal protein S12 methylthiotransferase accessory factor